MSFVIQGLGTAIPEHCISQQGAVTFATTCIAADATQSNNVPALVEALYRRAGVHQRYSVLLESSSDGEATAERFYEFAKSAGDRGPTTSERMRRYEKEAGRLVVTAAGKALSESGVGVHEITHLITVSCSGFSAPGADLQLIRELGLSATVSRTHVGFMGCHGALNGLRVARAFAESDPKAIVLVCAVELCSLHHQYGWDPQKIVANSLFADGAAAIVGRSDALSDSSVSTGHGTLVDNGGCVIPESEEMMTWRIADNGFEMSLSPEVPGIIRRHLPRVLEQFLGRNGLKISDVQSWAIHPGGPRILAAAAEAAGLSEEQMNPSVSILQRFGNMSSPTVLFILNELRMRASQRPCVMLGFGPGLNVELALIR